MISKCNICNNNSIIKESENKSTFQIDNQSKKYINTVRVDNCYITTGIRCDFLFEILKENCESDVQKVLYVELKGSDINHAIKQLEATILYCNNIHRNSIRECYIVAYRVPKAGTETQVLKKSFKHRNNIPLYIDTVIKKIII